MFDDPRLLTSVLLIHTAATWFMVGIIWFVQINHYPLFAKVGVDYFSDYETAHTRLTGYVVMPPMLTEAATMAWLIAFPPPAISSALLWPAAGLLVVVWGSTFLLQVPAHQRLTKGFDGASHRTLVATNWIRTAAWSLRGALALAMLRHA